MSETLETTQFAVIDLEGNGQQPPEIVEVAIIRVDGLSVAGQPQVWLVKPTRPITPMVARIHGIKNRDVESAPTFEAVSPEVLEILGDRIPVAHNARIDHSVLSRQLPGWRPALVIDTLRLAKAIWPGLPKYTLDHLLTHAHIDVSDAKGDRHRAGFDAHATALMFAVLAKAAGTKDELLSLGCLPGYAPISPPDQGALF